MPVKTIEQQAADATIKLAELQEAYNNSPEQRLARDRAYLEQLRNDPHHLDRKLAGSTAAANEERAIEAQIRQAEAAAVQIEAAAEQTEAQRIDAIIRGEVIAGAETTVADQIPRKELASAVGGILEQGVRPELIANFLRTGRSGGPDTRKVEIATAAEWERRLMSDPELQKRFLAKDPEIMKQFMAYGVYAAGPHEK